MINNEIKNQINANTENSNHSVEESSTEKQQQQSQSMNSGESANSSLQNINNLDSGISICSTSTPTKDLRSNLNVNVNKSVESNDSSKTNDEIISPNLELDDKNLEKKEIINQNECHTNNVNNEQATKSNQKSKPLEYYEINAEFDSEGTRSNPNVLLGEYHPIAPKLKCYEISTEL